MGSNFSTNVKRFLPFSLLIVGIGLAFYFRVHTYLNLQTLVLYHDHLKEWYTAYPLWMISIFSLIYSAVVALSLPGATVLSLTGGFLFGNLLGTAVVVVAATLGASLLFLAAQTAFKDILTRKAAPFINKMAAGFSEHSFNYLLFLRLVPLFPFWLVNIAASLLNVKFRPFVSATFIGIIPGAFIYTSIGKGLEETLSKNASLDASLLRLSPTLIIPLIGLSILSLVPVLYRYYNKGKDL